MIFFSALAAKSMLLGINCNKLYFDCYRTQNLKGPISSVTVSLRSKHIRAVSEQRTRSETQTPRNNRACSCSVSCAAKSENPVPRSFFALKPNGNACYGG